MDSFVRTLMSAPPLAAADELALARLARAGDAAARAELITSGLRSVALRARMLGIRGDDLSDAVQSGAIGLIRAVDRFDPDRGVRLATYAWWWIGAEMGRRHCGDVPLDDVDCGAEVAADADLPDDCLLDGLSDTEAEVLRMRFGLAPHGAESMPRHVVAERLGLTISQVRTIEGKAMRQLRGRLAKVVDRAPLH
ncbi:sigma factor [Aeromicrobium fastidiosum]|uniref:Sigma-70 family RNA polymerase sigma factor n=1 Tax=Aeromicrobium fastidiosum TaxID=52699 RepID=A0A641AML7_9ACTN|nr:sigma factor [Aeromicrobium fastidiosum]KAA1378520.1 hypothetical protein ESP62_009225 [Aeromicrobium fastidiosum]MBP2392511.1 DNA-directed RNA polymerase sigma subunit (sigma70/sigma32) [Aeromicrobium fastidiosum]